MKKELISKVLSNLPTPHYLIPETVVVSEDGLKLTGKVFFPLSDETIKSRGDHANNIHAQAGLWNSAGVMAFTFFKGRKKGMRSVIAVNYGRHEMPPETEIEINCFAMFYDKRKTRGMIVAVFTLKGKLLHKLMVDFSILK